LTAAPPGGAVAAYIRVSSRSQDHAYQRVEIDRVCRARGETIGIWFGDVASGRTMDRPELDRLRAAVHAGEIRRLWVWRLDRLTRSGIVDTLSVLQEFRGAGCQIQSVADGVDLEGPAAELIIAVLAWAAQMERIKIAENVVAARARAAREGRSIGNPRLPTEVRSFALALGARGLSVRAIGRQLGISKSAAGKILQEDASRETGETTNRPPLETSLPIDGISARPWVCNVDSQ
jgi:DNA invertase Pin-like site-specific DNA recombinase